ncbi:thioredoxin reductase (NADPH) [Glaciihabitans sp. UYNi722]
MKTTLVENYPGFADGIQGMDLMGIQAERFGTEVVYDDVTAVKLTGPVKMVSLGSGEQVQARTIIFATGSANRKLGLADETRLSGYGVSWCATCDGFFFRGQTVAVVGGGDSALEEATFLSRFADTVHLIHRGETLCASQVMQDRAAADPKIVLHLHSRVEHIHDAEHVTGITITDTLDGDSQELPLQGLFVAIESDPRTHLVHGQLAFTEHGTIEVEHPSSRTEIAGVFAAGDVVDAHYRQAVTAAASGTIAAHDAEEYLAALNDPQTRAQPNLTRATAGSAGA